MALKLWGLHETEIPSWQKGLLKLTVRILKACLMNILNINKVHSDEDFKKAEEMFEETDKILAKHSFLLGTEEPTYLDYTFASLAGILAFPDQYGGPNLSAESRVKFGDFTLETQKNIRKFRNTPSGKFVLKMYAEYR